MAVILYGSRAAGRERPESDVDLLLLAEAPERTRDTRRVVTDVGAVDVDGWIYGLTLDADADPGLMRLRGGRALYDPEGHAARLLAHVEAIWARGPKPVPDDERVALRVWGQRMLARIAGRDSADVAVAATARWRQAELVVELLADIYLLRGWWYPGPDPALRELATRAPELHRAYVAALAPDASLTTIGALVTLVMEE